jgi:hypothetical protein
MTNTNAAHAFGARVPQSPNTNQGIQATPIRVLDLAHVTVPAFYLPNGNRVDMNTDLKAIVDSQINQSRYFRTVGRDSSMNRLVINGGITSLELDILELGLKIGWNPAGALPVVGQIGVSGEVNIKLSNLSMDFKIYDRVTKETYLASYTNETLSSLKFQVKVEVSQIGTSLDLLTKTRLSEAIRRATTDIMAKLENAQSFHYLPWEARVLGVEEGGQKLTFSAGARSGVKTNFVFSVYSNCEGNSSMLCYERFLADVKVSNVGVSSADAIPLSSNDTLNLIYPGDKVFVKPLSPRR